MNMKEKFMQNNKELFLRVSIIQTNLDSDLAWDCSKEGLKKFRISSDLEEIVWEEISDGLRSCNNLIEKPHIILLPELALPLPYYNKLKQISGKMGCIIIAGLDYQIKANSVKNQAIFFVPRYWPDLESYSRSISEYSIGKKFPSVKEKENFTKEGIEFVEDPNFYFFKDENYGNIGIVICYDFMDVNRYSMYRGRIQHLFVLAYNKDVNQFSSLAHALSKIIFCNVVICNTGKYGGSMAVSPYKKLFKRTIYAHSGNNLFTTQMVKLPVKELVDAQYNNVSEQFKCIPPGYKYIDRSTEENDCI